MKRVKASQKKAVKAKRKAVESKAKAKGKVRSKSCNIPVTEDDCAKKQLDRK